VSNQLNDTLKILMLSTATLHGMVDALQPDIGQSPASAPALFVKEERMTPKQLLDSFSQTLMQDERILSARERALLSNLVAHARSASIDKPETLAAVRATIASAIGETIAQRAFAVIGGSVVERLVGSAGLPSTDSGAQDQAASRAGLSPTWPFQPFDPFKPDGPVPQPPGKEPDPPSLLRRQAVQQPVMENAAIADRPNAASGVPANWPLPPFGPDDPDDPGPQPPASPQPPSHVRIQTAHDPITAGAITEDHSKAALGVPANWPLPPFGPDDPDDPTPQPPSSPQPPSHVRTQALRDPMTGAITADHPEASSFVPGNWPLPPFDPSGPDDPGPQPPSHAPQPPGYCVKRSTRPVGTTAVLERPRVATAQCVVLDEFLAPQELQELTRFTLEHEAEFDTSHTLAPGSEDGIVNAKHRRSRVLMDLGKYQELMLSKIQSALPLVLSRLGMEEFPIDSVEAQITASNDGDFFHCHSDNGDPRVASRRLTFVYFFHSEPRPFNGGELRLYDSPGAGRPGYQAIVPQQNQIVFFDCSLTHEITAVDCPSKLFADSRFTLNGWLHQ
jgi:SM-20-related protein